MYCYNNQTKTSLNIITALFNERSVLTIIFHNIRRSVVLIIVNDRGEICLDKIKTRLKTLVNIFNEGYKNNEHM